MCEWRSKERCDGALSPAGGAMGNDSNRWRSSAIGTPLRTLPRTAVDFVRCEFAALRTCRRRLNGCRCGLSGLFLQIRDHDRQSDPQSVITNRSTGLLYSRRIERALARQWRQTTMKRTISTLAILGALAWPGTAKAGRCDPSIKKPCRALAAPSRATPPCLALP